MVHQLRHLFPLFNDIGMLTFLNLDHFVRVYMNDYFGGHPLTGSHNG